MTTPGPYAEAVLEADAGLWRRILALLADGTPTTREGFADLMAAAFGRCGLGVRGLSDDLGFNASTVHRWVEGRTAPHQSLWPRVSTWIAEALRARLGGSDGPACPPSPESWGRMDEARRGINGAASGVAAGQGPGIEDGFPIGDGRPRSS